MTTIPVSPWAGIAGSRSGRHPRGGVAGGGGQPAAAVPVPVENIVPKVDCATQLSAAQIKTILRRENELRLAPETQRLFAAAAKTAGREEASALYRNIAEFADFCSALQTS